MGKMNELSMLLDDLITCGTKLAETAIALKEFYSSGTAEQPLPDRKPSSAEKSSDRKSVV